MVMDTSWTIYPLKNVQYVTLHTKKITSFLFKCHHTRHTVAGNICSCDTSPFALVVPETEVAISSNVCSMFAHWSAAFLMQTHKTESDTKPSDQAVLIHDWRHDSLPVRRQLRCVVLHCTQAVQSRNVGPFSHLHQNGIERQCFT